MPNAQPNYARYQRLPGLVLGFHGCDREVGEALLRGKLTHLNASTNEYDWLGDGVYFWENDPVRAWEFAQEQQSKPKTSKGYVKSPFVVGAVIDLGLCLNLSDRSALAELASAYRALERLNKSDGKAMPANKGEGFGARYLDRAVVQTLHSLRATLDEEAVLSGEPRVPAYETVRSAFPEGDDLYEGAGFRSKNHIQIAVRDLARIKGYFRPIAESI